MDNGPKIKLGDVVKLKSGGPDMTVTRQGDNDASWHCTWMSGETHEPPISHAFPEPALVIKPQDQGGKTR